MDGRNSLQSWLIWLANKQKNSDDGMCLETKSLNIT